VARRAGIVASYLSRVENGKIQPTFRMVWRLLAALRCDLQEVIGPESPAAPLGHCPITGAGRCMLELIRPEPGGESYTPREVRLLRQVATWMKQARQDRVRALEVLLEELCRSGAS
jgi:transcriptional regulator with XRE-family HTH domain